MKFARFAMFTGRLDRCHHAADDNHQPEPRWLGPGARAVAVVMLVLGAAWRVSSTAFSTPSAESLSAAASLGDYDGVARALRAGISPDGAGISWGTPLL